MRLPVALVVIQLMLAASALIPGVARAAVGPPVIREPFTVLPCPTKPVSTIDEVGCAEHALLRSNTKIDAKAKRAFGLLTTTAGRTAFVKGEKAWLTYRRSSCTAEATKYDGGSAQPLVYLDCELRRNTTHLADLTAMLKVFEVH